MPDVTQDSGQSLGTGGSPSSGNGSAAAESPTTGTPPPSSGTPQTSETSAPSSGAEDLEFMFTTTETPSDSDLGLAPAPTPQPAVQPAAPPATPPVQPQAPAPAVVQEPPAQTAGQQPPAQPPASGPEVPAGLDRYDPAQLAQALAANEPQLVEALAGQVLKLSPQEVEALETNIVDAIPRLMARVLVQAQKSALTQMANIMPMMIQRQTEVLRKANSAEETFYKAWPQLNMATHGQMVRNYAAVFRQMHPQSTLQDLIQHVGPMVMMAAKVSPQAPGVPPVQVPGQTPVAARPNGRPPPPSPFVPAMGGAPVPGSTQSELNPWEAMFAQQDE